MSVKVIFLEKNDKENHINYYFSSDPMDPKDMPLPIASSGPSSTLNKETSIHPHAVSFVVENWDLEKDAYVRVSSVSDYGKEYVSSEFFYEGGLGEILALLETIQLPDAARSMRFSNDSSKLLVTHNGPGYMAVFNTSDWSIVSGTPMLSNNVSVRAGIDWSEDDRFLFIPVLDDRFDKPILIDTSDWSFFTLPDSDELSFDVFGGGFLSSETHYNLIIGTSSGVFKYSIDKNTLEVEKQSNTDFRIRPRIGTRIVKTFYSRRLEKIFFISNIYSSGDPTLFIVDNELNGYETNEVRTGSSSFRQPHSGCVIPGTNNISLQGTGWASVYDVVNKSLVSTTDEDNYEFGDFMSSISRQVRCFSDSNGLFACYASTRGVGVEISEDYENKSVLEQDYSLQFSLDSISAFTNNDEVASISNDGRMIATGWGRSEPVVKVFNSGFRNEGEI